MEIKKFFQELLSGPDPRNYDVVVPLRVAGQDEGKALAYFWKDGEGEIDEISPERLESGAGNIVPYESLSESQITGFANDAAVAAFHLFAATDRTVAEIDDGTSFPRSHDPDRLRKLVQEIPSDDVAPQPTAEHLDMLHEFLDYNAAVIARENFHQSTEGYQAELQDLGELLGRIDLIKTLPDVSQDLMKALNESDEISIEQKDSICRTIQEDASCELVSDVSPGP